MKNQRKNLIKTISISLLAFFAPSVIFADESTDLESFKAGDDYILSTVDGGATIDDATYIKNITKYVYSENDKSYVATTYGVYAYTTTTSAEVEGEIVDTTTYDGYVSNNATTASTGGAVNNTTDNSYESDFINNSSVQDSAASSTFSSGAILNSSTMSVVGDFIGNYVDNNATSKASAADARTKYSQGGAIYNTATGVISSLTGDFTNNYVATYIKTTGGGNPPKAYSYGGAIYNLGYINSIVGDFNNNHASAQTAAGTGTVTETVDSHGGAIYNSGTADSVTGNTIESIVGDFVGNYTVSNASTGAASNIVTSKGGAIYNSSTIGSIAGDFVDNYSQITPVNNGVDSFVVQGGAIYNSSTIGSVVGDFSGNHLVIATVATSGTRTITARGGAIFNTAAGSITVEGNFTNNYVSAGTVGTITAQGGAVCNLGIVSFVANTDSYSYTGNFATASDVSDTTSYVPSAADDANGGFLYQTADGDTTFDVGTDLKITIGEENCVAGYDSIAGLGTITKSGAGSLVVNSSMEYYTGTLTVSAGSMEVNNTLGASTISIAGDASLSVDVLAIYLGETSSLSLTNAGDLSIGTLAIYLSEDFEVGVSVALNAVDYNFTDSVTDYVVYDSDGELLDDSLYSYSIEGGSFTLAAVPEPSTYAMILGALALGFAYYRRRK